MSRKISTLKAQRYVKQNVDVYGRLVSYLDPLPSDFDIGKVKEEQVLGKVYLHIVKRYLGNTNFSTQFRIRITVIIINKMICNCMNYVTIMVGLLAFDESIWYFKNPIYLLLICFTE